MNEKPILFNGEMVRAILEGRKTITRRVVKRQPHYPKQFGEDWIETGNDNTFHYRIKCPYGSIGDLLWVRETFCVVDDSQFNGLRWVDYKATPKYEESQPAGWDNAPDDPESLKWKPSIFMPRWASRITLRVTGVRIEPLQKITPNDAWREGAAQCSTGMTPSGQVKWFAELWNSINAKRGHAWETNPWVWVVEFEKV